MSLSFFFLIAIFERVWLIYFVLKYAISVLDAAFSVSLEQLCLTNLVIPTGNICLKFFRNIKKCSDLCNILVTYLFNLY